MLAALLALPALSWAAQPGDAATGKVKSEEERCQECHGHDGNAGDNADGIGNVGKFPKLAGQDAGYIAKQLADFRAQRRHHDIMNLMAKSLNDVDIADIAAYFSSQARTPGDGRADSAVAQTLFTRGDAARHIPPCVACHQEAGHGAPRLHGQYRRYLAKQLFDWRAGVRRNSPGGTMNTTAKSLTDAEIEALADYIAGR